MCRNVYATRIYILDLFGEMDVKGAGLDALLGAREMFENSHPIVICKIEESHCLRIRAHALDHHQSVQVIRLCAIDVGSRCGRLFHLSDESAAHNNLVLLPESTPDSTIDELLRRVRLNGWRVWELAG